MADERSWKKKSMINVRILTKGELNIEPDRKYR